jgi:hypothetical protein
MLAARKPTSDKAPQSSLLSRRRYRAAASAASISALAAAKAASVAGSGGGREAGTGTRAVQFSIL